MGEHQGNLIEHELNRSFKVQVTDHRITSHAGGFLVREASIDSVSSMPVSIRRG